MIRVDLVAVLSHSRDGKQVQWRMHMECQLGSLQEAALSQFKQSSNGLLIDSFGKCGSGGGKATREGVAPWKGADGEHPPFWE